MAEGMLTNPERESTINAVIAATTLCQNVRARLNPGATREKEDKSPVTVADFGAQALVLSALHKDFPGMPAVGEEDASDLQGEQNRELLERVCSEVQLVNSALSAPAILSAIDSGNYAGGPKGRHWTLDPIDGTKGFLRNDQYAVALALIEEGDVVFGVLGCPHLPVEWQHPEGERGCLFVAEKGQGCQQLNMQGATLKSVNVDKVVDFADASFCESVESGHSKHDWAEGVARELGISAEPVRMDSQCKYAAIAGGDASIYLRLPTRAGYEEKIWDHAAGAICVTEAGGKVTDIDGQPLDFSQGATLKNNSGVIATNGKFHDAVVAAVQAAK